MQQITAEIKTTDRFGENPVRWKLCITDRSLTLSKTPIPRKFEIVMFKDAFGKRYRGSVTKYSIYDALAAVVKKMGGLE